MGLRAVFLDKDGTLVEDVPYNVDPARIRLLPGADQGLPALHSAGYRLFIISNQPGVARGYFAEERLVWVERCLRELLAGVGVPLGGFYYCPHHPEGVQPAYARPCSCRKPEPGLLFRAASEHGINLHQSWFVGDILDDIEAGRRAGCRTILLDNGHETEWILAPLRQPHYTVANLHEAARKILQNSRSARRVGRARIGETP